MTTKWPGRRAAPCWIAFFALATFAFITQTVAASSKFETRIIHAIENRLSFDQIVSLNDIDVSLSNGIVTLSGTVDRLIAKERAERLVETVRTIEGVNNKIVVRPDVLRSPKQIRRGIVSAYEDNVAIDAAEIAAHVDKNGLVTLSGTVDSWSERNIAATLAKRIAGVTALQNRIVVEPQRQHEREEIAAEVKQQLKWSALVDARRIDVSVIESGAVTLSGITGSAAEKRHAEFLAWLSGANNVDVSALRVDPSVSRIKQSETDTVIFDEDEIAVALTRALRLRPATNIYDIEAEVSGNQVTLRGVVGSAFARLSAERIAYNTAGVAQVINRIKVRRLQPVPDVVLVQEVGDAIRHDSLLDRDQITVLSNGGVVQLTGLVENFFLYSRATEIASQVAGVIAVDNRLRVAEGSRPHIYDPYLDVVPFDSFSYAQIPYGWKSDQQIRKDIKAQLTASPFVNSQTVKVTVESGVATLTGVVDGWRARNVAVRSAYEGGAIRVVEKLTFRSRAI